ncbi:MAG: right-handed parallel beta-helix repeat-containing protein, partial [bacterium]
MIGLSGHLTKGLKRKGRMKINKKRLERGILIFLALVALISAAMFSSYQGITGAVIGLPVEENLSFNESVDNFTLNQTDNLSLGIPVEEGNLSLNVTNDVVELPEKKSSEGIGSQDIKTQVSYGCSDTVTTNYTNMSADLGPCSGLTADGLYIGASNIVIDCLGHSIIGSNAVGGSYGISPAEVYNNITIRNCHFINFSTGIYLIDQINGSIVNNTFTGNTIGIQLSSSNQTLIENNTINTSETSGHGVYLTSTSNNNTLRNNQITTSGYSGYGIYLYYSTLNNVTQNSINTTGLDGRGISLEGASNSTLAYNTISTTLGIGSYGIYAMAQSQNLLLTSNIINTTGECYAGVYLIAANSTFTNNVINSNCSGVATSASTSTLINNTICTEGSGSYGIDVDISSSNIFTNNTITASGNISDGIRLINSNLNNLTGNIINISGGNSYGVHFFTYNPYYHDPSCLDLYPLPDPFCSELDELMSTSSSNSTLLNNTISAGGASEGGIFIYYGKNINLTGNRINASGLGIKVEGVNTSRFNHTIGPDNLIWGLPIMYNFSVANQTILNNVELSSTYGLLICAGCNNVTYNNVTIGTNGINLFNSSRMIVQNSTITATKGYGIYIEGGNATIQNNQISAPNKSIYLRNVEYNLILNNSMYNNKAQLSGTDYSGANAALFLESSDRNLIQENNFTNNSKAIYVSGSNNLFENNYFFNNTVGYDLESSNNNFTSELIFNQSQGIIIPVGFINNNTCRDCFFSNNTYDLNVFEGAGTDSLIFINSSIDINKFVVRTPIRIYFKWYVDVNITNAEQNVLGNALVEAYNSLNELEDNILTSPNGLARLDVTSFYRKDITNYYLTPDLIKASKTNYTSNSTSINLYGLTYASANLTLTKIGCGDTIYGDFDFGNNYICGNSGLVVGKDNIIINGNSYNLTGNGSGVGISINNKKNISIINLGINNFTKGLYLYYSNGSNFTNLIVFNNSLGVVLNNSDNNIFYGGNLTNNSLSLEATSIGETSNSLINVSVDLNNISTSGISQVYRKWYVDVNATYNSNIALPNANTSGYFNDTEERDYSLLTGSDGMARLVLSELKKNASGTYYLTPHNITLAFTSISGGGVNFTYVNLTQTNNTRVNLSLSLNCTSPYSGMQLETNSSTLFCPGTFAVSSIDAWWKDNVTLTCDNTILQSPSSTWESGVEIYYGNNTKINGCSFENYGHTGIWSRNSINLTINSTTSNSIECESSQGLVLNNSYISEGLTLQNCQGSKIYNSSLAGDSTGVLIRDSPNGIFINNTVHDSTYGVYFDPNSPSNNNSFYHNTFTGNTYNIYYFNTSGTSYINYFNTSIAAGYAQGNQYDDYCDKGTDLNSDGYADNVSSATTNDWPYSENISSKVYDPTNDNKGVIDYGPKITSCPAEEVFLGGGGGSSGETAATAAAAATPAKGEGTKTEMVLPKLSELEEARKYLRAETVEVNTNEDLAKVKITLENTGTKRMKLFPALFQKTDEPFFIVNKKTLGYEGSFFSKLADIAYSKNTITGRLLKAEILNPEQIVLEPGQKIEKVLEIKEGLLIPRQIKIQFTTLGEVVKEQEVEINRKAVSGTAVDVDEENKLVDIYALMVPEGLAQEYAKELEKGGGGITGAAISDIYTKTAQNGYFLELSLSKKWEGNKTAFSEFYGPYSLKGNQT